MKGLNGNGIRLSEHEDEIVWSWNVSTGHVNAKQVYDAIATMIPSLFLAWIYKLQMVA